jgi:hypothetical protein
VVATSSDLADALAVMAESFLAGKAAGADDAEVYQVVIHAGTDAIAADPAAHPADPAVDPADPADPARCHVEDGSPQAAPAERGAAQGGPRTRPRPVPVPRLHHMAVHDRGYLIAARPDGIFTFYQPEGSPLPQSPPLPAPDGHISDSHDAEITPETIIPPWFGERLDLDHAIYTCLANDKVRAGREAGRDPGDGAAARTRAAELEPGDWYPQLCQYKADQAAAGPSGRITFPDWLDQRTRAARAPAA